jgi:hypothetical protein
MKMKFLKLTMLLAVLVSIFAFSYSDGAWYKCDNCCKTKLGSSNNAPWESGCSKNSSGMHTYHFSGHAGSVTWACRNCKAEVGLNQGQSPAASRCCASSGTCSWYSK